VLFVGASAGNIIGPHLYTTAEAPRYYRGLISNLALFVVIIVLVVLGTVWLRLLNRKHRIRREELGKRGDVVDWSMQERKEGEGNVDEADGVADGLGGDKAFDDETDLRNEDFIYVY
jgi:hypothetical protein